MNDEKLYIVMMGLPARGKSTLAVRLRDAFRRDRIPTKIFNNGNLRRIYRPLQETSLSEFYSPENTSAAKTRKKIAQINMKRAKSYLRGAGQIAILDATNASRERRKMIEDFLNDYPILFIECVNDDEEILGLNIMEKTKLPDFAHLDRRTAKTEFIKRIAYYRLVYSPLAGERNYVRLDSLHNKILEEKHSDTISLYPRIRDYLVTDVVKNLFLIRHTETGYNIANRIGGNPSLTQKGIAQAQSLGRFFQKLSLPYIFTSSKKRTMQTAQLIASGQENCTIIPIKEFDEIHAGICEGMTYKSIEKKMPQIYQGREADKYSYAYPDGESYELMKLRIEVGIKKTFHLNRHSGNIMIIGHQAVNRMILSHFLYRREEDVPYIYIPQDRFYHIISIQDKKLFEMKRYD
jgi:broad specificity phosphatase PhoE/predicted kinase